MFKFHSVPTFRALALILAIAVGPTTGCDVKSSDPSNCVDGDGDEEFAGSDCDIDVRSQDCNDADAEVHTGATEVCDEIDNNCNSEIDEGTTETYYADADGDGYGSSTEVEACDMPEGYADNRQDCNDSNATINPAADELCDGVDNNCNGYTDTGVVNDPDNEVWSCVDDDGDGYTVECVSRCEAAEGAVLGPMTWDCDDTDPYVNDGFPEICDGVDNDCNGEIDGGLELFPAYHDNDNDGYGVGFYADVCELPPDEEDGSSYAWEDGDCQDFLPDVNPGKAEVYYNGLNDDCSSATADCDQDNDGIDSPDMSDEESFCGGVDCDDTQPSIGECEDTGSGDTGDSGTGSTDTGDSGDSGETGDTADSSDTGETDTGDSEDSGDTVIYETDFGTAAGSCSVDPFSRSDGGSMIHAKAEGVDPETGATICGVFIFGSGSASGPDVALVYSASYTVEREYVAILSITNPEGEEVGVYADLGGGTISNLTLAAWESGTLEVNWTADADAATLRTWTSAPTNYGAVVTGIEIY